MADVKAIEVAQKQLDAIKTVLDMGLTVSDGTLDTWLYLENGVYSVDGNGKEPVEEDFDDLTRSVEYFLQAKDRPIEELD